MDARNTLKCDIYKINRWRNRCCRYTTFQYWCGFSISIGNITGNATEPWISVINKTATNDRPPLQLGFQWHRGGIELVFKSLDCSTKRLFHIATIFCCYICICCLKLHQADYKVEELVFFVFLPRFGGGQHSAPAYLLFAPHTDL